MDNDRTIDAVFEDDIDKLFKAAGVWNKFNQGECRCKFCSSIITRENIYSFLPDSGAINLICTKSECVIELATYIEEKKKHKTNV